MLGHLKGLSVLALVAGTLLAPLPARAQPSTASVYDDVKEIIEELVTKEVAETVAPNLACYSRDGLLRYFPRTLQLVFERNLGLLEDTLREETIEFLGNYAYESLKRGKPIAIEQILPVSPPQHCKGSDGCECADEIKELRGPEPYIKRDKKKRGWRYPLDDCRLASKTPESKAEAATALHCELVASTVDAVRERKDSAVEHMARAVALVAYLRADFPATSPQATKRIIDEIVQAVRDQLDNGSYSERSKLFLLQKVSASRLDQLISTTTLPQLIATKQPRTTRETLGVAIALKLMKGEKISLVVSTNGERKPPVSARDALRELQPGSLAQQSGESTTTALVRALLERQGVVPQGTVSVTFSIEKSEIQLDRTFAKPGEQLSVIGSGLSALEKLLEGVRGAEAMEARLDELGTPQALAGIAGAVARVAGDVISVVQSWKRVMKESGGTIQPKRMLEAIRDRCGDAGVAGRTPSGKPTTKINVCALVDQAFQVFDPTGELQPLVLAALDGDLREVAAAAVRGVFSTTLAGRLCCDADDETDCMQRVDAYANLATSFVSYATLKEDDENAEVAARTAFKRAAFDVVTDIGSRKGFDRKPGQRVYIPTASLRASLSPSYHNQGADGFRYLASVDWLGYPFLLRDRASVRMELHVSAVDVLAPFSEIAFRHIDTRYEDSLRVFANFIRPTVELALGLPTLSTKLMLVGGGSVRPFIAKKKSDTTNYDYQYLFFGTKEAGGGFHWDGLLNAAEFGIGVKYVP